MNRSFAPLKVEELLHHLVYSHDKKEFEVSTQTSQSFLEFCEWKKEAESSTVSHFVNRWESQKTANGDSSTQFCCFRTEKKQSGTPFKCTAFMRVGEPL